MGRGRESCAQFSSISAGPTSRPATEVEPVAPRTSSEALSAPCSRSIKPRINLPPQSVWLSAIGRCLKLQYEEALAAPVPPRLAGLLRQFETRDAPG